LSDSSNALPDKPRATPAAPDASKSDICIHKVLSRGAGLDAQVLLVIVSASAPELGRVLQESEQDLWVAIDSGEPQEFWVDSLPNEYELAQVIDWKELQALDADWQLDANPFGLDPEPHSRQFRLARFDFSDHPQVHSRWYQLVKGESEAGISTLPVLAWRTAVEMRDYEDKKEGMTRQGAMRVPLPGVAREALAWKDVVQQRLFDLGVLFVHGIGDHPPRETLVLWAEPIVKFWRDLARAVTEDSRRAIDQAERARLQQAVQRGPLHNRSPLDGISQAVDDFARPHRGSAQLASQDAVASGSATPCVAAVRPEETLFADASGEIPSATLMRVSSVDSTARLRESHVLLAEAYWTREAFPPSFNELFIWLTTAIPVMVWVNLQSTTSRRLARLWRSWPKARGFFDRLRLVISLLTGFLRLSFVPILVLFFALLLQLAVGLIAFVGIILPIPWVRSLARNVTGALLGTAGQSYALQTSPVRRSAIVSAVQKRLDWLSPRCRRVAILSHSQGAEVMRRVLLESRRGDLARWYTFGAGIAPLAALHPRSLDRQESVLMVRLARAVLFLSILAGVALMVDMIPGINLGWRAGAWSWVTGLSWLDFAIAICLLESLALYVALGPDPFVAPLLRASTLGGWCNLYASDDPVPAGPLFESSREEMLNLGHKPPEDRELFNTRFTLLDHSRYWKNIEQFVAPIALDFLRLMGQGVSEDLAQPVLSRAERRRDLMTWFTKVAWVMVLLVSAGLACYVAFGSTGRAAVWWQSGVNAWRQSSGLANGLKSIGSEVLIGQMLGELRLSWATLLLLLPLAGLRWAVGWWSARTVVSELAAAARQSPLPSVALAAASAVATTPAASPAKAG
jgi:hypothetical protein